MKWTYSFHRLEENRNPRWPLNELRYVYKFRLKSELQLEERDLLNTLENKIRLNSNMKGRWLIKEWHLGNRRSWKVKI